MDRFIPLRSPSHNAASLHDLHGMPASPASPSRSASLSGWTAAADTVAHTLHRHREDMGSSGDQPSFHAAMLHVELLGIDPIKMADAAAISGGFESVDTYSAARVSLPSARRGMIDRPSDGLFRRGPEIATPRSGSVLLHREVIDSVDEARSVPASAPAGAMLLQNELRAMRHVPSADAVSQRMLRFNAAVGYGENEPLTPTIASGMTSAALSPGSAALMDAAASRRPRQRISRAPYRVLDAPGLADDFYLNLLDWSSQNVIAVGLGSDVYLWNGFSGSVSKLAYLGEEIKTASVSWSTRGAHAAIGTEKGQVQIWDASACKILRTLKGHTARVGSMSWAGHLLATGGKDKTILVRDLRSPADYCASLKGHTQEVCGLKWSLDWSLLASGGNDNKLYVWSAAQMGEMHGSSANTALYKFSGHTAAVKAIAWSPHQPGLLVSGGGTQDKTLRFWNTNTGTLLGTVDTGSQVCQVAWSPTQAQLVSCHGYSTNNVVVWRWPSMTPVTTMTGHACRVLYMAMSPDGTSICTGAGDETLRFWELSSPNGRNQSEGMFAGAAITSPKPPYGSPEVELRNLLRVGSASFDVR